MWIYSISKLKCSRTIPTETRSYVAEKARRIIGEIRCNPQLPEVEVMATEMLMFIQFDRLLAEYYVTDIPDTLPPFREYAQIYLARPHIESMVSQEAAAILREKYGCTEYEKAPIRRCPISDDPCEIMCMGY